MRHVAQCACWVMETVVGTSRECKELCEIMQMDFLELWMDKFMMNNEQNARWVSSSSSGYSHS